MHHQRISFEEQPLNDKTLSRFHHRCYDYEQIHGVDLYKAAITDYNNEIAKMMKLDGKIRRMDSMMNNSNMRMLARSELIYSCIAKLVKCVYENKPEAVPESLLHYAQPNDFNNVMITRKSMMRVELEKRMASEEYELCPKSTTGIKKARGEMLIMGKNDKNRYKVKK